MSDSTLYRSFNVFRRISPQKAVVYRCFELIPERGFVVQSADRIILPLSPELVNNHDRQLWELFCEEAPERRAVPTASIKEAIAAFDAEFENPS